MNLAVKKYVKPEDNAKANFESVILRIERHAKHGGRGAFFDLDLVLNDSKRANAATVRAVLDEYRLEPRPDKKDRFIQICSGPSPSWVLTSLVPQLARQPEKLDEMVNRLSEVSLSNVGLIERTPIADYLQEIHGKLKTAVLTNRTRASAHAVIDHLRLREFLDAIVHKSRLVPSKPDPTMVIWGLAMTATSPKRAIYFDDNKSGIIAAKAAGVRSMLVHWYDGKC